MPPQMQESSVYMSPLYARNVDISLTKTCKQLTIIMESWHSNTFFIIMTLWHNVNTRIPVVWHVEGILIAI